MRLKSTKPWRDCFRRRALRSMLISKKRCSKQGRRRRRPSERMSQSDREYVWLQRSREYGKGMVVTRLGTSLVLAFMLVAGSAGAQEPSQDEVVFEKHTVLTFSDDTIDGNLSRPDGQYLESRKRLRHERLIKVRRSFRLQLLHSVHGL